jgi:site-specific recombinase XerD
MKIVLKLLKAKKETPEGYPLVFEFSHQGKRKQKTVAFSKIEHFIEDHKIISSKHPDFDILEPVLFNYKITAKKIMLSGITDVEKACKLLFEINASEPSFVDFCENLFAEMEAQIKAFEKSSNILYRNKVAGNLKVYKNVLAQFEIFIQKRTASEIDFDLLCEFKNACVIKGNSKSTIHGYLSILRSLYNKASQKYKFENTKPFTGVFAGLKIKSYNSKKKHITKEAIEKLESWTGPKLKTEAVDLFLLQFYFAGADLIDLYYMQQKQISNERVYFERGKTNNGKLIDLKIHPKATAILKKYQNKTKYIFEFRKDIKGYETFRSRYAKNLKKVQKDLAIEVVPMGGNLGVKVARHTFATIGKNKMIDADILRELMGHERDDVDNFYKDRFPEAVRDAALFEIIG